MSLQILNKNNKYLIIKKKVKNPQYLLPNQSLKVIKYTKIIIVCSILLMFHTELKVIINSIRFKYSLRMTIFTYSLDGEEWELKILKINLYHMIVDMMLLKDSNINLLIKLIKNGIVENLSPLSQENIRLLMLLQVREVLLLSMRKLDA